MYIKKIIRFKTLNQNRFEKKWLKSQIFVYFLIQQFIANEFIPTKRAIFSKEDLEEFLESKV